jgi:hypothetical protein
LDFITVDASSERQAVAAYLDGKDVVLTSEAAFGAWGRRYADMDRAASGRIASAIKSCGWIKGFVNKHPV